METTIYHQKLAEDLRSFADIARRQNQIASSKLLEEAAECVVAAETDTGLAVQLASYSATATSSNHKGFAEVLKRAAEALTPLPKLEP